MRTANRSISIKKRNTIMIVDDNAIDRAFLEGLLNTDYDIVSASNGREAIEILEQQNGHISAIVLDIVMPVMDGYEVMKYLIAKETFAHIPIIISTALEDDETREKAIACGANGFVTKPYNRTLLLHTVKNAVRLRDMDAATEQVRIGKQQKELLDNLPGGAALYEFDGQRIRAVHINKSYWRLVGREPGDYTSKSIFDTIHSDDHEMIRQELLSSIRQERNFELDMRVLSGDGGYKPFHVSAAVTMEQDGKYAIYASFTPISEEAMSIQQMLPIALSTVMSSSDDYSYVIDKDHLYVCCSKSVVKLLGLESERDIFGKTDMDLFGDKLGQEFMANSHMIAEEGEPVVNRIEEIPKKDGGVIYVSTSIYPIRDASGNVVGQYGISHDITRERKLDFELQTLLNTIPSGVLKYAADESEQFEYINRNFIESLGYNEVSFKEKFHNCFREMIWHEDRESAEAEVILQEGSGEIGKFEYRVEDAKGHLHWIHDEGIKVTDSDGKSWYYVTLFDITEQREAEEKLRVSEEMNRLAMEHSGKMVARFDVKTRTLSLPDSVRPIFELPHLLKNMPEEQIEHGMISQETADSYCDLFNAIASGSVFGQITYQQRSTLGWRWIEAHYTTVFSDAKEPISAVVTLEDVTERLEKELVYTKWQQSLSKRPKDSYTLFRGNLSKNSFFDSCEGTLIDISFAEDKHDFEELTESYVQRVYPKDRERYLTFVNSDTMLASYYRGHRADSLEYRELSEDGSTRWLLLSVELVEYPNSKDVEAYLMYEDINNSKLMELATKERAETDPLTGVLNRTTFAAQMEKIISNSRPDEKHALMMVDIDDFKHINDRFGHDAGDQALKDLTKSIRARLRSDDIVGRLGGDEFLVFLKCIPGKEIAASKARQICSMNIAVVGSDEHIRVSVGVAMIPRDGCDFKSLYKKADTALYMKKAAGKNGYLFVGEEA